MLINHYIIIKYNESVLDKKEMNERVKSHFMPLKEEINGIKEISFSPNVIKIENRFDFMIKIKMDDSYLNDYSLSRVHKEWKSNFSKYLEKKAIFDEEVNL